jgi:hypothetical protein
MVPGCLAFVLTAGCTPAPSPHRAVLELYMAADGATRCVNADGASWKARQGCCPEGFSVAGFSAGAGTAYYDAESGAKKVTYRTVVCLQDP